MRKVVREAAVAVTSLQKGCMLAGVLGFAVPLMAAVLPVDRADALFHSYTGGGLTVNGPSILVRKQMGDHVSAWGNYYVDSITSATIDVDVLTGASTYTEERVEKTFGLDFLRDKTTMGLAYTNSEEQDFSADSAHFSITHSMFGDLTTVSLGYSRGSDEIWRSTQPRSSFLRRAKRQNFRLGLSQVMSKDLLMEVGLETVTDEGYLNNPYRSYSYVDPSDPLCITSRCYSTEVYPRTRTSHALALRGLYYLPYRAALKGEYRVFSDTWGIRASQYEIAYVHPTTNGWMFDFKYRYYSQTRADFYRDLFSRKGEFEYMARDKELGTYSTQTFGVAASYEFLTRGWNFLDKGSVNLTLDHVRFKYQDFRDARVENGNPGSEPLYGFSANVMRAFVSVWY